MTLPNLIGFSGYTEAGKDAAADLLVSRARFVKTYMTKPLEQALVQINPWIIDHKENAIERFADLYENLGEWSIKNFEESQRLLDMLEKEIGRKYWTGRVFDEVLGLRELGNKVVLSGIQHPDDLAFVRENDGVCVWIERAVKVRKPHLVTADDCDVVVANDGTLKELYVNLVTALEEYTSNNKETTDVD